MKKLFCLILALVLVLGMCACGAAEEAQTDTTGAAETTVATEPAFVIPQPEKEEVSFDHINELEPVDGVYQVHSLVGVQNMADHPDGEFEILCDIDLGGAVLQPIGTKAAPFTGEIKGNEFTISNFTVEGATADGDLGFFGVNDGVVMQLQLAGMTIVTDAATQRVGGLAGTNTGMLQRCRAEGTITAADGKLTDCGGAVGVNTGKLRNSVVDMDIAFSASGEANIGGLVGSALEGEIRDSDPYGKIEVTGGSNKNVGLLAGYAKDIEIQRSMFMGEKNHVDGQLKKDFIGLAENAVATESLWRDNSAPELDPEIREIREKAVQAMYEMGTVMWTVSQPINTECAPNCTTGGCHYGRAPGKWYRGLPYMHGAGDLERLEYCLDEEGVIEDWVYELGTLDGYQMYMGNDCYMACQMAWATVANSMNAPVVENCITFGEDRGLIPVGDWRTTWVNVEQGKTTRYYVNLCGEETVLEAYAQCRAGDVLIYNQSGGGHAIMAATDPVVVRDENGKIDTANSYFYTHEQGESSDTAEYNTTWAIDKFNSFGALLEKCYLPFTIREMLEGEDDVPEAHLEGGMEGFYGLMTGVVKSNFYLNNVTMVITDADGNEVFNKKMFSRVDKLMVYDGLGMRTRQLVMEYDLAGFTESVMQLQLDPQQTYRCVITAGLHTGDRIVVKDYTF